MDQLVIAADELVQLESQMESLVTRIIHGMRGILGNDKDQLESNLSVNQSIQEVDDF